MCLSDADALVYPAIQPACVFVMQPAVSCDAAALVCPVIQPVLCAFFDAHCVVSCVVACPMSCDAACFCVPLVFRDIAFCVL